MITHVETGRTYVGQTIFSIQHRFNQHCSSSSDCPYLKNAIKKYGPDAFTIELLQDSIDTQEEADASESFYIRLKNARYKPGDKKTGFNLTDGGQGSRDDIRWLENHAKLVLFAAENRRMPLNESENVEEASIASWANTQRVVGRGQVSS